MYQPQPAGLPSGTIGGRRQRSSVFFAPLWRASAAQAAWAFAAWAVALLVPWWAATTLAQAYGVELRWAVSPSLSWSLMAVFGVLPLVVSAVALAVLPRWLQPSVELARTASLPARALATPLYLMFAGLPLALVGLHLHTALAALGLALGAAGLALVAGRGMVLMLESPSRDRDHARVVVLGLAVLAVAQWVAAVALALHAPLVAQAAAALALWGGAALVLTTVALRQMPRFAADVLPAQAAWHSRALLAALSLVLVLEAMLNAAQVLSGGVLGQVPSIVAAAVEAAASLLLCWLALRWGLRASLARRAEAHDDAGEPVWARAGSQRLLAMGHAGFAWAAAALGLQAVSHLTLALSEGQLSLGAAPALALGLGTVASLSLALCTREAARSAGQPLCAARWDGVLACVLQAGALFAVLGALFPAKATALSLLALQFCGLAALTWALRQRRR